MSFERRTALLDFARAHDAFVFEDDFYAEFRFTGPPLPCLQGIDDFGRVIYAGTMSKILYPSLRLGYVVAPEQLIDPLVKIRSTMDQHSSAIDQATLARFINEGFFLSHIKRMRKLYAERREFFIKEFNELLGDRFTFQIPEGGLNFVAWLRCEADFARLAAFHRRSESNLHRYHFIASKQAQAGVCLRFRWLDPGTNSRKPPQACICTQITGNPNACGVVSARPRRDNTLWQRTRKRAPPICSVPNLNPR